MENKYDNEFVRDIYGKSKGLSREEFSNELNDAKLFLYNIPFRIYSES